MKSIARLSAAGVASIRSRGSGCGDPGVGERRQHRDREHPGGAAHDEGVGQGVGSGRNVSMT
jgi:hypothetical protein